MVCSLRSKRCGQVRTQRAATAVCLMLLASHVHPANAACKMLSNGQQSCSLPERLSNFQGNFGCSKQVQLAQPTNVAALQQLVKAHHKVTAVGVGHSWWKEQFCSGHDRCSLNIVTTGLTSSDARSWPQYNASRIVVDESKMTVRVAAGVLQRDLLKYIGNYRSLKSPMGYTLPAFSWFVDQTMAGAVATGTHGSSFRHASLSSQMVAMTLVLANGTIEEFTESRDSYLWKALQVNVGRLGVVVDLTFRIVRQALVVRSNKVMSFEKFVEDVRGLQGTYNSIKNAKPSDEAVKVIDAWDEASAFWALPLHEVTHVNFRRFDSTEAQLRHMVAAMAGQQDEPEEEGVDEQHAGWMPITENPVFWSRLYKQFLRFNVMPGAFKSEWAYLSMSKEASQRTATFPYDQYEVAIPLEVAAECLEKVGREVYGPRALWKGMRTPALIRFVNKEDAYLSPTNGGARMYINIEDYVSYATKSRNKEFQELLHLFRAKCQARLHWGKCGWPEHAPCFDGAKEYPHTWCHFGCAVHQLDPTGKFSSISDVWQWRAKKAGMKVPFQECCKVDGFDYNACSCRSRTPCQQHVSGNERAVTAASQ